MSGSAPSEEMLEHIAIERALQAGRLSELPATITVLPDYPNVRDRYTWTPLIITAISKAPVPCVTEIIGTGADVNVEVDDGFPALLNAVMSGRDDRALLVQTLVEAGADLGRQGINGWTALHAAASMDDGEMVALLLRLGADPDARTGIDDDPTPR